MMSTQLRRNFKESFTIEVNARRLITGKLRYNRFGYLCMVYLYVTVFKKFVIFKCVIKFDKVFLDLQVLIGEF